MDTDTSAVVISIERDPKLNYRAMKSSLRYLSSTEACEVWPEGMNATFSTETDFEFALRGRLVRDNAGEPVLDEHGNQQLLVRPQPQAKPARHAQNATNAQVSAYEQDLAHYNSVARAKSNLRKSTSHSMWPYDP